MMVPCIEAKLIEESMFSRTWLLQQMAAIVSYLCIVMGTASLQPLTIRPQICTVRSGPALASAGPNA